MRPAIFLDRDGTINLEVNYLSSPDRLRLIDGAAEAINHFRAAGYVIIVVTNQSGVARGYFSAQTLEAIHEQLHAQLARHGARVDGVYTCPHHPDEACDCRKPNTRLFLQAAREHNIDLSKSFVIGDKETDILAAKNLNIPGILVRTGFGAEHSTRIAQWHGYQPAYVADDLLDAAQWLLNNFRLQISDFRLDCCA